MNETYPINISKEKKRDYFNLYHKYKSKYLSLKKNLSIQKGGNCQCSPCQVRREPKVDTVAGQLQLLINSIRTTFIPNNSTMFESQFYFNEHRCLELSINLIYKLGHEAQRFYNDPSYSAKMSLLHGAIKRINTFLDCIKSKFNEHEIIYYINDYYKKNYKSLNEVPINNFEMMMMLFRNINIDPFNYKCENLYTGPIVEVEHGKSPQGGPSSPSSIFPFGPSSPSSIFPFGPSSPLTIPHLVPTTVSPFIPNRTSYIPQSSINNNSSPIIISPIIVKSDDSSSSSEYKSDDDEVTKISIEGLDGEKLTFVNHGLFKIKKGKSQAKYTLEIYINSEKLFFIETNVKKSSNKEKITNQFFRTSKKTKQGTYKDIETIKFFSIKDNEKEIKIDYNIESSKDLIKKITELVKLSNEN